MLGTKIETMWKLTVFETVCADWKTENLKNERRIKILNFKHAFWYSGPWQKKKAYWILERPAFPPKLKDLKYQEGQTVTPERYFTYKDINKVLILD